MIIDDGGSWLTKIDESKALNMHNAFIYPNPVKETIYLKLFNTSKTNDCNIRVIDVSGKTALSLPKNLTLGANTLEINVSAIQSGVYFIEIKDAGNLSRLKVIIEQIQINSLLLIYLYIDT